MTLFILWTTQTESDLYETYVWNSCAVMAHMNTWIGLWTYERIASPKPWVSSPRVIEGSVSHSLMLQSLDVKNQEFSKKRGFQSHGSFGLFPSSSKLIQNS